MARQYRTPKQRAEAALGLAQRRYDRAAAALRLSQAALDADLATYDEAHDLLAHAKAHPALQDEPTLPLGGES